MITFYTGLLILTLGWILLLFLRSPGVINRFGALTVLAGCAAVLASAVPGLGAPEGTAIRIAAWDLPLGSVRLGFGPLSSFFLILIAVVSSAAAVFAPGYLRHHGNIPSRLRRHWFFYSMLIAGMMLVVTARDAILFLLAWEIMSLTSFFLVEFDFEKKETRRAGWLYLVCTHAGTAFLLVMFSLLARESGSWCFADFIARAPALSGGIRRAVFLCGLIGFGIKAGLFPGHVWLPRAHPAAPSHVSAVMSGVMIKTGLYGILITLSFCGVYLSWFGWLLLFLGLVTGCIGILFAAVQPNLKGLLAYSSVENVGIMTLGFGIGILGRAYGNNGLALLGFSGGLLHLANHALFKSLLFLGSGSVQTAVGSLDIDSMGGLLKRLPVTGVCFLLGAVAITGLPPLNGFIGEFLLYSGALATLPVSGLMKVVFSVTILGGLSFLGALAVYCFTKVYGIAFLGIPRSGAAEGAVEQGLSILIPMVVLAALCIGIGFLPHWAMAFISGPLGDIFGLPISGADFSGIIRNLLTVRNIAGLLILLVTVLFILRRLFLRGKVSGKSETWGCGYGRPTARMQYTGSSFTHSVRSFYQPIIKTRISGSLSKDYFPEDESIRTATSDPVMILLSRIVFVRLKRAFSRVLVIQHGNIHLYVLYILAAILAALLWSVW